MKYSPISIISSLVVIVLILAINYGVQAEDSCKRLKKLDYEYFGTKTMYEDALKFIETKDEYPKSFSDDSLEKEHKELVEDSCQPIVFYFIGRHSARFPDGDDIEVYNRKLTDLKSMLRQLELANKCPGKFDAFLNWTSKMQYKHDNLITDLGGDQQRDIARRFKSIYPEFFSTEKAEVKIGVTSKLRTAQTGAEFLKEVDGLFLPKCDRLPTNDLDEKNYDLDKILQSDCYKEMIDKHTLPFLDFHKQCKKIGGNRKFREPLVERARGPSVVKKIAERVTEKLGLPKESLITYEMLDSIYNMCKFENALKDDSIWCSLFEKKDIQAYEYIADIDSYLEDTYGKNVKIKQSCPLVKDLIESFQDGLKLTGINGEKRRAYFYFSHADPMKKLLGAFGMFKDDDSFSEKRVDEFVSDLKVPKKREWRSSVIVPFSANMAFVLYRCQKPGKTFKHKILATVTERPVKLGGCEDFDCNSNKFFDTYNDMKECDLNKICSNPK